MLIFTKKERGNKMAKKMAKKKKSLLRRWLTDPFEVYDEFLLFTGALKRRK